MNIIKKLFKYQRQKKKIFNDLKKIDDVEKSYKKKIAKFFSRYSKDDEYELHIKNYKYKRIKFEKKTYKVEDFYTINSNKNNYAVVSFDGGLKIRYNLKTNKKELLYRSKRLIKHSQKEMDYRENIFQTSIIEEIELASNRYILKNYVDYLEDIKFVIERERENIYLTLPNSLFYKIKNVSKSVHGKKVFSYMKKKFSSKKYFEKIELLENYNIKFILKDTKISNKLKGKIIDCDEDFECINIEFFEKSNFKREFCMINKNFEYELISGDDSVDIFVVYELNKSIFK